MGNLMLNPGGPRFNRGKVFLKPAGGSEEDWKEITNGLVASNIIIEEGEPQFIPVPETGHKKVVLNFTVKMKTAIRKRTMLRLAQMFGFAKAPRCTYKTIRRDCAKRNKYKR